MRRMLILVLLSGCVSEGELRTRITYAQAGGIVRAVQGEAVTCTFRSNDPEIEVKSLTFSLETGCSAKLEKTNDEKTEPEIVR